jgi:hypothetical protein
MEPRMTIVAQLPVRKGALEAQSYTARKAENSEAIAKVRALIADMRSLRN